MSTSYERVKKHRTLKKKRIILADISNELLECAEISEKYFTSCTSSSDNSDIKVSENVTLTSEEKTLGVCDENIEDTILATARRLQFQTTPATSNLESGSETSENSLDTPRDLNKELYSTDSSEETGHDKPTNLRGKVAEWARKNIKHLPHTVVNEILQILRSEGHWDLPKCAETLLGTKRSEGSIHGMISKRGKIGEYVYLGIVSALKSRIINSKFNEKEVICIINVDGFLLFNKSDAEMMPILMQLIHPDYYSKPFAVALYAGNSKPASPNDLLSDFIEECSYLIKNGLEIEGKHFKFILKAVVCDTPARAFLKCTKGHTGFFACERCEIKGISVSASKTNPRSKVRVYPDINCKLRTKESFENQSQPEHHHEGETSPLLRIPGFDPVLGVLLDYMHLLPEGTMKLLIEKWLTGTYKGKISLQSRQLLSQLLLQLSEAVPEEFQRNTFALDGLANWKATQFRFVLLYAGAIVLRKVLSPEMYKHFLLLYTACRILFNPELAVPKVDYAEQLLRQFVSEMPQHYGISSQVMNIHNLIHVAEDVRYMQAPLSEYSAFPFENCLGEIKAHVRTPKGVVPQVFRRFSETEGSTTKAMYRYPAISEPVLTTNNSGDSFVHYKSVKIKKMFVATTYPNNVVQLKTGEYFQLTEIIARTKRVHVNNFFMKGFIIPRTKDVFKEPMKSEEIGVSRVVEMPFIDDTPATIFSMKRIHRKCILLNVAGKKYIVSLLHL